MNKSNKKIPKNSTLVYWTAVEYTLYKYGTGQLYDDNNTLCVISFPHKYYCHCFKFCRFFLSLFSARWLHLFRSLFPSPSVWYLLLNRLCAFNLVFHQSPRAIFGFVAVVQYLPLLTMLCIEFERKHLRWLGFLMNSTSAIALARAWYVYEWKTRVCIVCVGTLSEVRWTTKMGEILRTFTFSQFPTNIHRWRVSRSGI